MKKLLLIATLLASSAGMNAEIRTINGRQYDLRPFCGANFRGADFSCMNFRGANFEDANLERAKIGNLIVYTTGRPALYDMKPADFSRANLRRANLTEAQLTGAKFVDANLVEANLTDVQIDYSDFRGADLRDANFEGAILEGVSRFEGADLRGVRGVFNLGGSKINWRTRVDSSLIKNPAYGLSPWQRLQLVPMSTKEHKPFNWKKACSKAFDTFA